MRQFKNVIVTGGAGFIGSNFIRHLFNQEWFTGNIINIDALTYAGNFENLDEISQKYLVRYWFQRDNICNFYEMKSIIDHYGADTIINFAAESHVDRSINGPGEFIRTNITGTFSLLEAARTVWKDRQDVLFHHVSTDEVYGSLGDTGYFYEDTPYDPRSPYSASKAASDHLVKAYYHTYGIPVTISNCSNNYGPYQFPEKLIPVMIMNILNGKPLPVYGDGKNVRDWIFVEDHNRAIFSIMRKGIPGETYNIGGETEVSNIDLVNILCEAVAGYTGEYPDNYKKLITFVKDRPGHDKRYAINCDKIKQQLGWSRMVDFQQGINTTVKWYLDNQEWMGQVLSKR